MLMTLASAIPDTGLLAAVDLSTVWHWTVVVFYVILGLGAVIFVHELGHFLVAKACGVKCDKFYVGFDVPLGRLLNWLIGRPGEMKLFGVGVPRTIGPRVKWGETEYGIGILPLGGYVKMLGQDDDPGHVAEQMQKSQVDESSANGVEVVGPNGEKYFVDRRSYVAKSVPQRMAIISAGVTMNIIFAFIFAVIAYGMGVPYMPSIVSQTVPGSPAWKAGIEPGDQIVQIGQRKNPTFMQLRGGVTLGDLENGIPAVVRRAGTGELESIVLKPERGSGLATIGIMSPQTVTLLDGMPVIPGTPAAEAKRIDSAPVDDAVPKGAAKKKPVAAGFQGGDQIVRVDEVEISDYRAWAMELVRRADQAIEVTVRRPAKRSSDDLKQQPSSREDVQELTFNVPARPMHGLGLIMRMGPILAVQSGSPAAEAGLKAGDVIEAVDGKPFGSITGEGGPLDPATLPERLRQAATAGQTVTLTVNRQVDDAAQKPAVDADASNDRMESHSIIVTPRVPTAFNSAVPPGAPLAADAIGIAYRIENQVQTVVAESPATKAKIEPGDQITAAKFIFEKDKNGKVPPPLKVKLVANEPGWITRMLGRLFGADAPKPPADLPNWPFVHAQMQQMPPGTDIELTIENENKSVSKKLTAVPIAGVFVADRGFAFEPIQRIREADTLAEQIQFGWDETVESLTMVYRFLQKIGTQVPITALGGPVTIAKAAGYSASAGIPTFLIFLTMLSANLAVVNFLPIPLLDGGHMVFLAYEGVRGRPANEKIVGAMHMAGFVFIVSLMLFVLGLDFGLIERNL